MKRDDLRKRLREHERERRELQNRQRPGVEVLFDLSTVRHIDQWRKWAEIPFLSVTLKSDHRPGTPIAKARWILIEDGEVIASWLEADMPRFARWLSSRMAQAHGAWHVAREALKSVPKQSNAGKRSGEIRRNGSKAERIREGAVRLRKVGLDPLTRVPKIAREAKASPDYVRKVLKISAD